MEEAVPSTYARPHLLVAEQVELLRSRGLTVAHDEQAQAWLLRLGYYRLSAFWYPFRKREMVQAVPNGPIVRQAVDQFKAGACFEDAVALYAFDKALRLLVMEAIEQVEIAARVDIAHHLGAHDKFAHENPKLLDGNFTKKAHDGGPSNHEHWLAKLADYTNRSREEFVNHYRTKWGEPLPIWVAIEVWDFGLVSRFTSGMRYADRFAMAQRLGVPDASIFVSWLRSMNYLRNLAAHHSRLWNRNIVDQPKLPKPGVVPEFDAVLSELDVSRVYALLCILAHLVRVTRPDTDWHIRMADHLRAFPSLRIGGITTEDMGCPKGWTSHPFWH